MSTILRAWCSPAVTAVVIVLLVCLNPVGFLAPPAAAHTHLVTSSPRAGATLSASPSDAVLTFDQPIQAFADANAVVVYGPRNRHWACGPVRIHGNTVRAQMSGLGPPGRYLIVYRVIGGDGHPITGSVPIRVRRSTAAAPTTATSEARMSTVAAQPNGLAAMPMWLWASVLTVLVGLAGAIVRRAAQGADPR